MNASDEAKRDVQKRLRSMDLCGTLFVDPWGDEAMCILPTPCAKHPTVAPVSGEPGGVRVVWTGEAIVAVLGVVAIRGEDAKYILDQATSHARLEVDRKELEDLIDLIASNPDMTAETVATRLGLTLSDGGTDG